MKKLVQQALDKARKDIKELPLNNKNSKLIYKDLREATMLILKWEKDKTKDAVGIIAAKKELEELNKKMDSRVKQYVNILSEDINRIKRTPEK